MEDFEKMKAVVEACVKNAEHLIGAAKDAYKPGRNHIAYHLATIALEELGKATMITASSLSSLKRNDERTPAKSIDDHEKKLFWALWSPLFGRKYITVEEFREFQELARHIHELRLASLYVDPKHPSAREDVSDQEAHAILSLAESSLGLAHSGELQPLDAATHEVLDWFFFATGDQRLKPMVFSAGSMAKLAELNGNTNEWVKWLRATIEEADRMNRELAIKELNRPEPQPAEEHRPKWEMKLRLYSWSHSVRPKPLRWWNDKITYMKLFPTAEKNEVVVQFSLPMKVAIQTVWPAGMQYSMIFVVAMNIGSFGYFWWYVPKFVSKYYESLFDVENQAPFVLERNPPLIPSWADQKVGRHTLDDSTLNNVIVMFTHLAKATAEQRQAYERYFRALGLLAKNDIFVQIEPTILMEFYESFLLGLRAYGDWDGNRENLSQTLSAVRQHFGWGEDHDADLRALLEMGHTLFANRGNNTLPISVTIEDVAKMKAHCDVYFFLRGRERFQEMVNAKKQEAAESSN